MEDVRRTSRLSRNSDGKEAELKVRRKCLVAAPKADDDIQQTPMWSDALIGKMTIDFADLTAVAEHPGTYKTTQNIVVSGNPRDYLLTKPTITEETSRIVAETSGWSPRTGHTNFATRPSSKIETTRMFTIHQVDTVHRSVFSFCSGEFVARGTPHMLISIKSRGKEYIATEIKKLNEMMREWGDTSQTVEVVFGRLTPQTEHPLKRSPFYGPEMKPGNAAVCNHDTRAFHYYVASTAVKFIFDPTVAPIQEPKTFLKIHSMMCFVFTHAAHAPTEYSNNMFPGKMSSLRPWIVLKAMFGTLIHSWHSPNDPSIQRQKAWFPLIAAFPTLIESTKVELVSDEYQSCLRTLTTGGFNAPCACHSRRRFKETLADYDRRIDRSKTANKPVRTVMQVDIAVECGPCEQQVPPGEMLAHCYDCKNTVCWGCRSADHETWFYNGVDDEGLTRWVLPFEPKIHATVNQRELLSPEDTRRMDNMRLGGADHRSSQTTLEDRHEAMERENATSPWQPEAIELNELSADGHVAAVTKEQSDANVSDWTAAESRKAYLRATIAFKAAAWNECQDGDEVAAAVPKETDAGVKLQKEWPTSRTAPGSDGVIRSNVCQLRCTEWNRCHGSKLVFYGRNPRPGTKLGPLQVCEGRIKTMAEDRGFYHCPIHWEVTYCQATSEVGLPQASTPKDGP